MSSIITVSSSEGESILPEMGEFSEFHPDQLSNLVDIQEELDKLVAQERLEEDMSMSTVDDVDVVDHEVTIGEDQDTDSEMTILPDIPEMEVRHKEISSMMEESLEVGQTITIEAPPVPVVTTEEKKSVPIKPVSAVSVPVSMLAPGPGPQLKAIRPLPEALKGKRPASINLASLKKNVLTKVIFTPNNQGNLASDSPIIVGEAGPQAIRIIGQNKTIINSPRTITLAQAREMGLKLSPSKVQQIFPNQQKTVVRQNFIMDPNKTYAMVKSSPTKILPLPSSGQLQHIAPSPSLNTITTGGPHKIIIRHSSAMKTGAYTNTILTSTTGNSQGQILQIPVSQDNLSNQIHQIQLPGKQVQYVRLMSTSTPAHNNAGLGVSLGVETKSDPPPPAAVTATTPSGPVSVALATTHAMTNPVVSNAPIKMLHIAPSSATTMSQNTNSFERVLVSPGLSQLAAAARPDTKPTTNNIVMVPAEYVKHYKPPPLSSPPSPTKPAPVAVPLLTKAKESSTTKDTLTPQTITQKSKSSTEPPNGLRPRKPCNCTKSQCLKFICSFKEIVDFHSKDPSSLSCFNFTKRYCDCFANGEFCFQCNCNCCFNNLDHEEDRQRAIKACLERNPNAFRPKIGKGYIGDERRHNKGCNCKRSGCLKNYCECYEAKIPCSNNCKCVGCRNVEDNKDSNDRNQTDGSKINHQTSVKSKLSSEIQESVCRTHAFLTNQGTRQPFNLMTQEVVEATCQCLLAVEGDTKSQIPEHVERLILEEFGRCLVQIIDCATRTTVTNNT